MESVFRKKRTSHLALRFQTRLTKTAGSTNHFHSTPSCNNNSSSSSSSSSICGTGGNPAYRTSAFEAVCNLTPVLFSPFISRGAPRQTA
jgi:hypothetical protein